MRHPPQLRWLVWIGIAISLLLVGNWLIPRARARWAISKAARQLDGILNSTLERKANAIWDLQGRPTELPDLAPVLATLHQALELNPGSDRAHLLLGRTYFLQGDMERAISAYQAHNQRRPEDPMGQLEMGFSLERLCLESSSGPGSTLSFPCADPQLQDRMASAWQEGEMTASEFYNRGEEDLRSGAPESARAWYYRAALLHPAWAFPWLGISQTMMLEGRPQESLEAILKATQLEPGLMDAFYRLGRTYESLGDLNLARQAYEAALEADYGQVGRSNIYFRLGRLLGFFQVPVDRDGAWRAFEQALNADDYAKEIWQLSETFHQRGNLMAAWGRWPEAIDEYQMALSLRPDHYWYYLSLAKALWQTRQMEQAFRNLEFAINLEPGENDAYRIQGDFFASLGQFEAARTNYQQALLKDPLDDLARQKLQALGPDPG